MSQNRTKTKKRNERNKIKRLFKKCHNNGHDVFQFCKQVTMMENPEHRIKSSYDSLGGGTWKCSETFECEAHQTTHFVEVVYIKNPIDVNVMVFKFDDKQYYTMM